MFNVSRSLYWKITIPFIIFVLAGMSVLGFYTVSSTRNVQLNHLKTQLLSEATLVAEISKQDFNDVNQRNGLDSLAKSIGGEIETRITFIAVDGTVLGDSDDNPSTMENHAGRPEVIAALQSGVGQATRYSTTLSENMMYVAVIVTNNGTVLGIARVALPLTEVEKSVNGAMAAIAGTTALATLVVIVAAALITRMITRPVRRMTKAADAVAKGKLGEQIAVSTNDEIGRLGHTFNEMSAGLKNMMAAVEEERSKLAIVLSGITDGVVMADSNGNILLVNPAVAKLFDFNEGNAINKPFIEAVQDHEVDNLLKKCLKTGQEQSAQLESISGRFLRVITVPVNTGGSRGALVLFQDLTELRSLQTMRREFVGNISHELRTPLAGIRAIVDTLRDGAIEDRAAAANFLNRLDIEIDGMTQMVNELLELSRIETGRTNLNREQFSMNELIEEVINRLSPQAERQQITIAKELDATLPLVQAEKERIKQVVMNILHNAIKFTPPGGRITISTNRDTNSALVQISDTGIGIGSEDLPHIFERFFKADKSRSSSGTGLGLAIAKHIIQNHNGKIWVRSEPGKGSTFSFSLPFNA